MPAQASSSALWEDSRNDGVILETWDWLIARLDVESADFRPIRVCLHSDACTFVQGWDENHSDSLEMD